MAITTIGHSKTKNFIKTLVKEGRYTLNGVQYKTPLYKVDLIGDVIKFYLYLDETVVGNITRIELLDKDGDTFDDTPDNISKPEIRGLLIEFQYTLKKI